MRGISMILLVTVLAGGLAARGGGMPDVNALPLRKEMPDPLVMDDGAKVTSARQWEARRTEIKRVLEYYSIGTLPPPPGNVQGHDLKSQRVADGKVSFRLVHLTFGPAEKLGFDVAVFVPGEGKGPFPTFVFISFDPTPGTSVIAPANNTAASTDRPAARPGNNADPEVAARRLAPVLDRGYAIVTYNYQEAGQDNNGGLTNGIIAAYPDYDWHLEGAWGWSMSRVADYLQTQPFADKSKLIAIGHSRLGKATLFCAGRAGRFRGLRDRGISFQRNDQWRQGGIGRGHRALSVLDWSEAAAVFGAGL